VTVLPRGRALGVMFSLPYNEKGILTRKQLLARLDIAMGGRVAEELLNGKDKISSGASSDLENASQMARAMVMSYGMGAQTGVFTLPDSRERGVHPAQMLAPETMQQIDAEVAQLLKDSYARALSVISTHRVEWERLAQALIEHEVLDAKQVRQAVAGLPVTRKQVHKFKPSEQNKPTQTGTPATLKPAGAAAAAAGAAGVAIKRTNADA
jgi:ATP-dependent metalloprotease